MLSFFKENALFRTHPTCMQITSNLCYTFSYVIELKHGEFSWRIKKRYHHFQKLDAELLFHRAKKAGVRHSNDPGRLSFAPAILLQHREDRQRAIETYIQDILDKKGYYKSRRLQEFFEISRVSFIRELGMKRRLVHFKKYLFIYLYNYNFANLQTTLTLHTKIQLSQLQRPSL